MYACRGRACHSQGGATMSTIRMLGNETTKLGESPRGGVTSK